MPRRSRLSLPAAIARPVRLLPLAFLALIAVGIKRRGEDFTYAPPETFVDETFELIVSGPIAKVEAFCSLTNG